MARWWESQMVDASQQGFSDPSLALQVASAPSELYSEKDQQQDEEKARESKSGFLGKVMEFGNKVDGALSNIPGWGVAKQMNKAILYPADKLASGMHWLYSETVSQPLSTLLLQAGKSELGVGDFWDWEEFKDAYGKAENISPGQAFVNYENVKAAQGDFGAFAPMLGLADTPNLGSLVLTGEDWEYTGSLSESERETVNRQAERFLYDTDFWRSKEKWKYTVGTGATDFGLLVLGDPSGLAIKAGASVAKGARSVKIVENKAGELVRDQGSVIGMVKKQTPLEEVANGKKMNQFYDWVNSPGQMGGARKSAEEIAAHPIWGKGRRENNFKHQYSDVLARTPREEMPMMYRFFAGDNRAVADLTARGGQTLANIGKISENRVLVDSVKFDPAIIAFFAEKKGMQSKAASPVDTPPLALSEDVLKLHEDAAESIVSGSKRMRINAEGKVSALAVKRANDWKAAKLSLIDDELKGLSEESTYLRDVLGGNMGATADEFSPSKANLFGNMEKAYRQGGGAFKDPGVDAAGKFARNMKDRKGRMSSEGIRKGFTGVPLRIIQSFGDNAPVGRVNHNETDSADRVLDMLKQVPGLGKENRMSLLNRYTTAGDKVGKSRALDEIHQEVINHMATRVHGLNPEVAGIIGEMTKVGVAKTMDDLLGFNKKPGIDQPQMFSSAVDESGRRVDAVSRYVDDGVSYGFAPLARTQLQQTDTLLPVKEIERAISRSANSIKGIMNAGGRGVDAVETVADAFNSVWKASTLLRPAYVPRMISEEAALSAIKFGFMSRLVVDPAKGAKNFVLNRAQYINAELGRGSYAPSTGAGIDSSLAVVRIGDDEIIQSVKNRQAALKQELEAATDPVTKARLEGELKATQVKRIRVNSALPVVRTRIAMEKELHTGLTKDLKRYERELSKAQEKVAAGTAAKKTQRKIPALEEKIADIRGRMDDHQVVMDEFTDYANEILRAAAASTGRRAGEGKFEAYGYEIPAAFSKDWENPIPRDQVTSDKAYAAMYARGEAADVGRMMKTGGWTTITPDQPQHMDEWVHALNRQFGQDEVFQLVAEDGTGKLARNWLNTPAGKNHLEDLGIRGRDVDKFVDDVVLTLDKYLPADSGLRQKMVDGDDITKADLAKAIAEGDRPVVHGQEIKATLGMWSKDTASSMLDRMIEKGFKRLGSIPSDVMSRQPVYLKFQEIQYKRLLQQELSYRASVGKADDKLTSQELNKILEESDKLARKDISQIVYDPKRTSASEAMRFLSPFFSAHMDGLSRWGGMIAEQPQMLTKIAKVYNAPVAANLVTDENGNSVGMDGYADVRDPITGKIVDRHFVPIDKRTLHLRMPWADKDSGSIPLKIQSINTIMPGDPWFNPGSGPLVQVAGSEIAKSNPQVGDFLQWAKILPYGPSGSATEALTPKYMRAIYDAWKGADPDNEAYQRAYLAVYNMKVAQYHESEGKDKFTKKEVEQEAKAFLNMEVLEAWASPGQTQRTPLTGTPYQFFVDQYSQMKAIDPEGARDKFLAKYGPEYMSFTASLSKSMGIASTVTADQMAEKYKDQIADDPDMASFWVGNVYNGGPFSSSVYKKQMEQTFGDERAREKITAGDAITKAQEDAGWGMYMKVKTQLDAALIRSGFKSYTDKGAEGFNEAKKQLVERIAQQQPAWGDAFNKMDRGKVPSRIKSFEKAVQDERLMSDPMRQEMQPLAQYLILRQQFKQILASRGASQLSYGIEDPADKGAIRGAGIGENADLANAWNQAVLGLVNSNTAFGDLYNRYLSNDNLQ